MYFVFWLRLGGVGFRFGTSNYWDYILGSWSTHEFQVGLVPGFPSMEGKFHSKRKWPYEFFLEK